ncbi:transmembrane protein 234-like [Glandiceps talaboti]
MIDNLRHAIWLSVVACLWGSTNPLIKRGSAGIEHIHKSNPVWQFLAELKFLVTNWKYVVPFLINQSGSLVYYLTLASAELSLAVPITNSLTFIFTFLSGKLLGENIGNKDTYIGMLFVMVGVSLCVMDKSITDKL